MEFLRFGSSIPGGYWGCCAACIIQNFKVSPSAKASIQLVDGDGGSPITGPKGGALFAGPTYADILRQRLRIGTFSSRDMPNHAFFAILTESQVSSGVGKEWLKILKEEGFEFLRTVDNSVYTGANVLTKPGKGTQSSHRNYVFALFRNIGTGAVEDQFTPPSAWTSLPDNGKVQTMPVGMTGKEATQQDQAIDMKAYEKLGAPKFLTEADLVAAGAPIIMAGLRSENPPEAKASRDAKTEKKSKPDPFGGAKAKAA